MLRNGAGHRLANPPEGVGAELEAFGGIKFVDGPQQAQVAFLNEIVQRQAAPLIASGKAHNQFQVGLDKHLPGPFVPGFDAQGHLLFFLKREQGPCPDVT